MPLPRRTPAPPREATAAERARTVAARGTAYVHATGLGTSRLLAATTIADGDVLLAVPRDGGLLAAVSGSPLGDLPVRVTVTDRAAVPLRRPVRGRVVFAGWVTPVPATEELDRALAFAEACPSDVLLDVGLAAALLRLDVAEVLLEEGAASVEVDPEEYAAARPDPLACDDLLSEHAGALAALTSVVRAWTGTDDDVQAIAVDRFGVVFRVDCPTAGHDLRLPFGPPVTAADEVGPALAHLLHCAG